MTHPRRWLLTLLILAIVGGGLALAWVFDGATSIDAFQARIAGLGVWAPVGFVLIYAIATVAMIPGGIFDLAGGVLFGPILGSVYNLAGASLGAAGGFLIARYIAGDWVERRAGPRVQKVVKSVNADGWRFVAFVRLVPIFPYTIINYLLGLTGISFTQYMLATVVFMLPSTIAYTWIGHTGSEAVSGDANNIRYALAALALIAIVIMAPRLYKRMRSPTPDV
jgi:uncharacterized membrane protein YdjX (TVP38/TMEM64 family)